MPESCGVGGCVTGHVAGGLAPPSRRGSCSHQVAVPPGAWLPPVSIPGGLRPKLGCHPPFPLGSGDQRRHPGSSVSGPNSKKPESFIPAGQSQSLGLPPSAPTMGPFPHACLALRRISGPPCLFTGISSHPYLSLSLTLLSHSPVPVPLLASLRSPDWARAPPSPRGCSWAPACQARGRPTNTRAVLWAQLRPAGIPQRKFPGKLRTNKGQTTERSEVPRGGGQVGPPPGRPQG